MPATYLHPGVYVEEVPSGSKPIEAVGTSTALFIGYCLKGPIGTPVLIGGWGDYERIFGGLQDRSADTSLQLAGGKVLGDPMGHAVYAFFQNGGGKAYVQRMATGALSASASVEDGGTALLTFTATSPGTWADGIVVRIIGLSDEAENNRYRVEVGRGTGNEFEALEVFAEVDIREAEPDFIASMINDVSELVTVELADGADVDTLRTILQGATDQVTELTLDGGENGSDGGKTDYNSAFSALRKVRDINMILLPGHYWASGKGKDQIEEAIGHAEYMRNCMVIYDPPPNSELTSAGDVQSLGLNTSTYGALYYPWAWVANPFYDAERAPGKPRRVLVSPAAFAAGMWARTDGRRGVWKAPAGVEATLLGLADLEYVVENDEQDFLNPSGVNAFRRLPGYGSVIWGSRTLATRANPEWRYVPVRRTAVFIEESLYNGIKWAVFEPNDHRLWSALRTNIESFMNGLFRVGAFQGEKSSDAYFVRCGLGSTMTQGDIDAGRVIVEVGFAPLKPAEFVIVRIQQKVGQQ